MPGTPHHLHHRGQQRRPQRRERGQRVRPLPAGATAATWAFASAAGGGVVTGPSSGSGAGHHRQPAGRGQRSPSPSRSLVEPRRHRLLTNTATVSPPAGVTDPDPADNSASDTDTLTPQADLSITKTDGDHVRACRARRTTYTIVVSNAGPAAVTGASVSDPLSNT